MNGARQIAHIFRKDVRAHWSEAASILLLNGLLILASINVWSDASVSASATSFGAATDAVQIMASSLLIVSWCLLIGRVIQADSPAGNGHYWQTRPYSRMSLLIAKIAYIVLVVHLLTAVSQIVILRVSGVSFFLADLVRNQAAIAAVLSLPMAVVASVTGTLGRYVFASLLVTGLAGGLLLVDGLYAEYAYYSDIRLLIDAAYWQVNWPRAIACLIAAAAISVAGLVWQYRNRKTLRVAVACSSAILLTAGLIMISPASAVSRTQTWLIGDPDPAPVAEPRRASGDLRILSFLYGTDNGIYLPFEITGAGPDDIWFANESVTIRLRSGIEHRFEAEFSELLDGMWFGFEVPPDLYRMIESEPVSLAVRFDLAQFGNTASEQIPLDGSHVSIDSREQCGLGSYSFLVCRSAFRGTGSWRVIPGNGTPQAVLSRQSGPISLAINPISVYQANLSNVRSGNSIQALIRKPVAYYRSGFEIELERLSDWRNGFDAGGAQ